jgi:hypothetical protein
MRNSLIRRHVRAGHARSDQGDVGDMHPIGTRVMLDGMTLLEYAVGKSPNRIVVLSRSPSR